MVDCADRDRIDEARQELHRIINDREMREAIILIFANKQDLPNAMNAAEITDKLGLHSLRNRNWYIQVLRASFVAWFSRSNILGYLCNFWRWAVRGFGLAEQPAQERHPLDLRNQIIFIWTCILSSFMLYFKIVTPWSYHG